MVGTTGHAPRVVRPGRVRQARRLLLLLLLHLLCAVPRRPVPVPLWLRRLHHRRLQRQQRVSAGPFLRVVQQRVVPTPLHGRGTAVS